MLCNPPRILSARRVSTSPERQASSSRSRCILRLEAGLVSFSLADSSLCVPCSIGLYPGSVHGASICFCCSVNVARISPGYKMQIVASITDYGTYIPYQAIQIPLLNETERIVQITNLERAIWNNTEFFYSQYFKYLVLFHRFKVRIRPVRLK